LQAYSLAIQEKRRQIKHFWLLLRSARPGIEPPKDLAIEALSIKPEIKNHGGKSDWFRQKIARRPTRSPSPSSAGQFSP